MKANSAILRRLMNRDEAVSPVIATILMVAITVVLSATVYVWVSGFSGRNDEPMNNLQITAVGGEDIITLKHLTGDAVRNGSWKVSVTLPNEPTSFCFPYGALNQGVQYVFTNTTSDCSGAGSAGNPAGAPLVPGDYKVVVVETLTNTVLLDRTVTVVTG
ncbi:MAG TPA: type IV pilin [Candidatus Thermoplasmatota archaeon]|nr:type IV pilin [Candidatus Thermoplasmatota archaeon]